LEGSGGGEPVHPTPDRHLRGAFVIIDKEPDLMPIAKESDRERRLWDATADLLRSTTQAGS
jgi:hypothetical protein